MKTLLSLVLLHVTLFATVDITPIEIGEKEGISTTLAASLSTNRGNTDRDVYALSAKVAYDNAKSYVLWSEASFKYGQANAQLNEQKAYVHVRYIRAITSKKFCLELFSQIEDDRFRSIKRKLLSGGGVRWNFFENPNTFGKGYLGIGTYNEYITYLDSSLNPNENNWRINSYIAYTKKIADSSDLTLSMYYQPLARFANDFIYSGLFELKLHIYLELYLSLKVEYNYDSQPPFGVKEEDLYQLTSFIYKF